MTVHKLLMIEIWSTVSGQKFEHIMYPVENISYGDETEQRNTQAKRNFATHFDLSVEIKDIHQRQFKLWSNTLLTPLKDYTRSQKQFARKSRIETPTETFHLAANHAFSITPF